jgi:hypothetical protein
MKASLIGAIVACVALGLTAPVATEAQTTVSSPPAPVFAAQQLDQLLAPVALYPDELLGQILMAATYPLEVVEAARWLQDPNNRSLTGDALAAALAQQDWDPSVKALVPFPQILQMLNDRLDWMQKLGDAFLAQQAEVMDAVQRLRQQARAAGALVSTPQQLVTTDGPAILIEPANPDRVYPPYYDPRTVYGPWSDPDYPPYYFPPPAGYVSGPPLFFGIGIAVIPTFWGWDHVDWRRRHVHIDVDRFNRVNRDEDEHWHRPPVTQDTWQHDPHHRRGVAYRDPAGRARFTTPVPGSGSPDARRGFRGFDNSGAVVGGVPVSSRGTGQAGTGGRGFRGFDNSGAAVGGVPLPGRGTGQTGTVGRGAGPVQQPAQEREFQRRSPVGMTSPVPAPPTQQRQFLRRSPTLATPPPTPTPPPSMQQPAQTRLPAMAHPAPPPPPAAIQQRAQIRMPTIVRPPPTPPPAFAIGRGQDVRVQSNRGQQSLQTAAHPVVTAPAPHAAPQTARPAGGGGAQRDRNFPGAK